jgi:hypothetical protein
MTKAFYSAILTGKVVPARWAQPFFSQILKPMESIKSPLDISGINLPVSSKDIVNVIREMRERNK